MITQPLLAAKKPVFEKIKFPVLATPKIDGIRCLKINGQALSRSFKPIPNKHIRNWIEQNCPDGFDGEILCGNGFNDVQSMVMSFEGTPDFTYLVFDYVNESLIKPYASRMEDLVNIFHKEMTPVFPRYVSLLLPEVANNLEELYIIMERHLAQGHEGTMIRDPGSPYKCGRSSLKEGYLIAIKTFVDDEAEIVGFQEQMHNANEQEEDAFGNSERSSKKENMVPMNTLGAFLVRHKDGTEFKIGTGVGLTKELRQEIWNNKDKYLGKLAHYRYQPHGVKDRPRIPSWYGFRDPKDLN
jgi:DNA ligase-1